MNFLDVVILIPISYAAWVGFKKGLIIEVFTLLALFVGLYAGIHFSEFIVEQLKTTFKWDSAYISPVAFTLTFLGVGAMVYFGGKALEKVVKAVMLSPLNKAGGVFFAILKASYLVSIVLVLFASFDKSNHFIPLKAKEDSLLYFPLQSFSTKTIPGFKESGLMPDTVEGLSSNLTVDELIRAKELADSLGIEAKDVVELHAIYDKFN
jgi:membrane protein required for colicin V production